MTNFILNIDLVEQTDSWYFSVDSKEKKESRFKRKCGLLQRQFNESRIGKSIELTHPEDAKPLISHKVPATAFKQKPDETAIHFPRLLRDNEPVLRALKSLDLAEWKVIFRAYHSGRIILEKGQKAKKPNFTYYSILVKMRLKHQRKFIEIGEGTVQHPRFNQDGLILRARKVVENHLQAKPQKFQGKVPVVLNAGDGAILFHELLGHSLEADYIYHGQSPISLEDRGKKIISGNVTLTTRDETDPFFKGAICDDEGGKVESHILVENGILRHVISDRFFKEQMNLEGAGHCRVEDFSRTPMPRMFSLYVKPGEYHPDELISSTPFGVYAGEFGEGKVNFEKNLFYFFIREAWLIENGKLTAPLGSVVVRGNIFEVLNSVEMVANDFRYDKGISYCFKNGQTLNVRVGQPSVKIGNLFVSREYGF